jgi:predicted AlkP superfamily phosphohydrolase/phosphomutase
VKLNNLFARKGWLKYSLDPETGEPKIDWKHTKVIYLKMDNIFIDPDGIGDTWSRASGEQYEKLRDEVTKVLVDLREDPGGKPVASVVKWEDVEEFLDLPSDRVGDLVVANHPGYGWNEEVSEDGKIFSIPLKTGYKQAIFAKNTKSMWTPFIIAGKGVKKNNLIEQPIEMVDQFPTIMRLLGEEVPGYVQGRVLEEIFE